MSLTFRAARLGLAFALVLGCSPDDFNSPGDGLGNMIATIDGVAWSSDQGIEGTYSELLLVVTGLGGRGAGRFQVQIVLAGVAAPGSYPLGPEHTGNVATIITANSPVVLYTTALEGGSGTVTITSLAAGDLQGTFTFTGVLAGGAGEAKVVTNGTFKLRL